MGLGEKDSPRPNVHFTSESPSVYRYDAYSPDYDFIEPYFADNGDSITESADSKEGISSDHPKRTNPSLFYDFLDHVINILSDGSRFNCVRDNDAVVCFSCKPLIKILSTYIDITTLEDIIKQRNTLGICGYVCCNKKLPSDRLDERNRKKSTYKIDFASKKIYKRSIYNSFCSARCIDDNKIINTLVSKSPVETGNITPRAIRSVDNSLILKLHDDVINLPKCMGLNATSLLLASVDINSIITECESKYRMDDIIIKENNTDELYLPQKNDTIETQPEDKKDKCLLLNYDFEDNEKFDFVPNSSPDPTLDLKSNDEIYVNENTENSRDNFNKHTVYVKPESPRSNHLFGKLSIFSMLWYLLSNYITDETKELLNTGFSKHSKNEMFPTALYDACMSFLSENIVKIMDVPIKRLLSTFNTPKNLPKFDQDVQNAIAAFILHTILNNQQFSRIGGYDSNFVDYSFVDFELDSLSHSIKDFLLNTCLLDNESLFILSELINDNI
ncbi:hypothetical protein BEWA_043550 [Theileria equi strain WA]|uniref:RNA polymerase II subunit B1 CTD phosphatase RPAP2 homolog n=1 Tax=Theileria equi strain WA TaxID=1537102 RepID=L1LGC0_THEEQ|nr:hypothetical protein BEWA_043550 [Theileria equi strain WA]EKX74314.1 hypothetical protein BEWA_043550 [Theileria equi strain WA]|eukprot:XP_004833766.1 hypothetical protein BEWA_043550 [Theileria equi strain WA]